MNKKLIVLSLIAIFIITSGFGCKGGSTEAQKAMKPITLDYWRVWDGPDTFQSVIAEYKKIHPNVTINYRKLSLEEYEEELLNSMAEDRGPCMFSVNSNWLKKYQGKISPMPAEVTMAYPKEVGTIKKEIVPVMDTKKLASINNVKSAFIDTVYKDVILDYNNPKTQQTEQRIYGMPLAVDTMVMYYNRDLLNNAGIADLSHGDENGQVYLNEQFQLDVQKLTKQDSSGKIEQAGIALGGGKNIERSADVLALMMMQNGAQIIDPYDNKVVFADNVGKVNPGIRAINIYLAFSSTNSAAYSWNAKLDNAQKMFLEGRLAILFSYSYLLPIIKTQAPRLNYGVLPMLQIEGMPAKNMADYWVETVSKKCKNKVDNTDATNVGWDFINFITYNSKVNKLYLDSAKRVPALRASIEIAQTDAELGVFAKELLTSRTWYNGYNYQAATAAMQDMIDAINLNPKNTEQEIRIGQDKISRTLDAPNNGN